MPTHLYCLLPAGAESAPPAGANEVRALEVGGIVAWVADSSADRLPRDRKGASLAAIDHDRVIGMSLARGVTPIPAMLADPYPSDAAAAVDISARSDEILAGLTRAAGMVEMTVIITAGAGPPLAEEPSGESGPGRAYLERLRDLPSRLGTAADAVDSQVSAIALATSRRADPSRVATSHLVTRNDVTAYREAALRGITPLYRLLVDGPRAPYSFFPFAPRVDSVPPGPHARHETGKLNRDENP